jgi:hypothetical protein
MAGTGDKTPEYCHVLRTMMYRFNGHKISEGINQCYLFYSKKDFQSTNLLIFQVLRKAAVVQGISSVAQIGCSVAQIGCNIAMLNAA